MKNVKGGLENWFYFWNKDIKKKIKLIGKKPDVLLAISTCTLAHKMTYLDFVFEKEHSFIRNIFSDKKLSERINKIDSYYTNFTYFIQIVSLLHKHYCTESDIEDIDNNCIVNFISRNEIESFQQLYNELAETKVKILKYFKNSKPLRTYSQKLWDFLMTHIVKKP